MKKSGIVMVLAALLCFGAASNASAASGLFIDLGGGCTYFRSLGNSETGTWSTIVPGAEIAFEKRLIPLFGIMGNFDLFYDFQSKEISFDVNCLVGPQLDLGKKCSVVVGIGPDVYTGFGTYGKGVTFGAAAEAKIIYLMNEKAGLYVGCQGAYDFMNINDGFNIVNEIRLTPTIGFSFYSKAKKK